jgi:ketosteroid isomerase-like protein
MSTEQNKAFAAELIKAISVGDAETIRNLVAEDCTCWIAGFPRNRPFSREQMLRSARTIIDEVIPGGFNLKIDGMTAEGDRVAVEAEGHNHTVTGKLYNNFYHFLFELRDGKVIRWREYTNPMHALEVFGDAAKNLGRK